MSSVVNGALRGLARPLVRRGALAPLIAASSASLPTPLILLGAERTSQCCAEQSSFGAVTISARRFGRKGARMGHHLETLDEMAHRGSKAEAREKRKAKRKRGGKKGADGGPEDAAAAPLAASPMEEDENLTLEEHADETKFDHGEEEDNPLPDVDDVKGRMMRVVSSLEESFRALRGAEPTPELFETIPVKAYGTTTTLSSVAQVVIAGPNRATLTCYDPDTANAVRDAVRDAGLNFNPQVEDGGTVVVPIPKVSMETRKQIVKQIGKAAEQGRQRVRRIRRAAQDVVKKGKDGKLPGVGEDEAFKAGKDIDAVTEEAISKLNEVVEKKQESVMAV